MGNAEMRPQLNLFSFNILTQRLKCMLELLTPEIKKKDKINLMRASVHKSLLLVMVKSSTFNNLQDQIDFVTGPSHRVILPHNMEPLTLEKQNAKDPLYKKHERFRHAQLRKSIGNFIEERDILIMTLYLIILDLPDNHEVEGLKGLFTHMLCRKVGSQQALKEFFCNFNDFCYLMQKMNQELEETLHATETRD